MFVVVLLIFAICPVLTTIWKYKTASVLFWLGFGTVLFTEPWRWEELTGFGDLGIVVIMMFITLPLYGSGIIAWIITFLVRREKHRREQDPTLLGSLHNPAIAWAWKIYFGLMVVVAVIHMYHLSLPFMFLETLVWACAFTILYGYIYQRVTLSKAVAKVTFIIVLLMQLISIAKIVFFIVEYSGYAIWLLPLLIIYALYIPLLRAMWKYGFKKN